MIVSTLEFMNALLPISFTPSGILISPVQVEALVITLSTMVKQGGGVAWLGAVNGKITSCKNSAKIGIRQNFFCTPKNTSHNRFVGIPAAE